MADYLRDLVWHELAIRSPARHGLDEARAVKRQTELLVDDFGRHDPVLESWSWLYYRYLADDPMPVADAAKQLGFTAKTLQRRLDAALVALARRIAADESAASAAGAPHAGAPIQERIRVVPRFVAGRAGSDRPSGAVVDTRDASDLSHALLATIRSEDRILRLSQEEVASVLRRSVRTETEHRLARIVEWSQADYRLDTRFVSLTLLLDRGEDLPRERWEAMERAYLDLATLLAAIPDQAIVVLGAPGSGKSTLLRHLELSLAAAALRNAESGDDAPLTFFVQLNQYKAPNPGGATPAPGDWLGDRWHAAYPALPDLPTLLSGGRIVLLLDGLNEIPAADDRAFRAHIGAWKDWLVRLSREQPGNRVIFSCRTLDYSASLSTPSLRVPQAQIEPLSDDQVRSFLERYSPASGAQIWDSLSSTGHLQAVRSPFFLALLVDQVESSGELAGDRESLFTGFVRQALRREVEQDNPQFRAEDLLTGRDRRRLAQWHWRNAYELPERGALIPHLVRMAFELQLGAICSESSQLRLPYDEAVSLLDHPRADEIIGCGVAIGVLDEDPVTEEILFRHQLLQEYFAARMLAASPRPGLVAAPWRDGGAAATDALLASLPAAERLPSLPRTGWEETTVMAARMTSDLPALLRGVLAVNLPLAGQCAAEAGMVDRLPPPLLKELRAALVDRSQDPGADLRERVAAAQWLGLLGDPRFVRRDGPHGAFLEPLLVAVPAATYAIGHDEPIFTPDGSWDEHVGSCTVDLPAFQIGRFPVTNAEFGCFIAAGGYDDDRWWTTPAARRWRDGTGTADSQRDRWRRWRGRFLKDPGLLDAMRGDGRLTQSQAEDWAARIVLSDAQFERHLITELPHGLLRAPQGGSDPRFDNPAQPVVGVSWYEASAYTAWLSAQSGRAFELPSEAMWEAAARGADGRRFPNGAQLTPGMANVLETRLRTTSPVGVFPECDTPAGVSDLAGNVWELTSSLWGDPDAPTGRYPYRADDGREAADAPRDAWRIARGGGWQDGIAYAQCWYRYPVHPGSRGLDGGFRVALREAG
ncbi:MAG: SUMF1/EgtB/PvdO family nonheme iron enzyme [Ardenticatenales bacterium]|nr:SUMF1/EgtB/PvdO family nonheme iron enzyme [Ardenticatenales bacterium]